MNKPHLAAPADQCGWRYSVPEDKASKMHLLTVGFVAIHGSWYGDYGQYLIAWAPMPKRDKETERALGLI